MLTNSLARRSISQFPPLQLETKFPVDLTDSCLTDSAWATCESDRFDMAFGQNYGIPK